MSAQALIDPTAKIGVNVVIGPWTVIGPHVEIGDGSRIDSHVIIRGHTKMGRNNRVFQFASVGEDPSDKKYHGEASWLVMGDNNVIREGVTIHRGTETGGGVTRIGSDNLLMPYTHVAHDCIVGNHTVFSNNAAISGHVEVADWAILGGYSGVYQFLKIGAHSFIGALTHVNMDVPAYVIVNGNPPGPKGINTTGLERRGFSRESINTLRAAYRVLYRKGLPLNAALQELDELTGRCPEVKLLAESVRASTRGIVR